MTDLEALLDEAEEEAADEAPAAEDEALEPMAAGEHADAEPAADNSLKQLYVAILIERIGFASSTTFSTMRYESSTSVLDGPVYTWV